MLNIRFANAYGYYYYFFTGNGDLCCKKRK